MEQCARQSRQWKNLLTYQFRAFRCSGRYVIIGSILCGCAGPTSPFGGLDFGSGDGGFFSDQSKESTKIITVTPKRQVLHKPAPLQIEVTGTSTISSGTLAQPQIRVIYNNKDVTHAFLRYAGREKHSAGVVDYIYEKLHLRPDRRHQIDIYLQSQGRILSHIEYLPPDCPLDTPRSIASVAPFRPRHDYISTINASARSHHINPSLLAGLIAQESGFEPDLVSRAKAVGLTQVTPLADEEIKKLRPEWARDSRVENLDPSELGALIQERKIGGIQDWRLDPSLAIEGGALYLDYLHDYWSLPENKSLLYANPKVTYSEVILASYNSGAARVKNKIQSHGQQWLDDDDLKEAFKYVNSVESYCYHFSSGAR
jgi:hypothetical protein